MGREREYDRSRRAPQVVQTSAMDCGPAVLTSLLRGHGLDADLDGVRDLCATGIDGTSVDVLGELAVAFGLRARQLVVPPDHLGSTSLELLPAVVVTELPGGLLHFVVAWRRVGRWVMVMDPTVGRRWTTLAALQREVYRHEMTVPTAAWRHYAGTDAFTGPLRDSLGACGVGGAEADGLIAEALRSPAAGPIARLDAAARRGARSGYGRAELCASLDGAAWSDLEDDSMVVADLGGELGGNGEVSDLVMRGAVVLSVDGTDPAVEVPASLAERVLVPSPSPVSTVADLVSGVGAGRLATSVAALFLGSVGSIAVAYLLGELVERPAGPLLVGISAVLFIAAVLGVAGTCGVISAGRQVELELRCRLEDRVGRLPDRFFATRPSSDLAERAHGIHRLRDLASSIADLAVAAGQVLAAAVVLVTTAPGAWWTVVVLVAVVAVSSLGFAPALAGREHRSRTIAGALSHVYLDSLIGALPVRAHRAAGAVQVEHGELLDGWSAAERSRHRLTGTSTATTLVCGYGAAMLVVVTVGRTAGTTVADVALVGFLAFVIVNAGLAVTRTMRRVALQWVVAQRLLALTTAELDPEPTTDGPSGPAGIELRSVRVDGASEDLPVLDSVSLRIAPGEHVGIVGPSGAGKSTLIATILGWTTPSDGDVVLDGRPLTATRAAALRRACGWIDPDVSIWAGTLAENLRPGTDEPDGWQGWATRLGLDPVLARLGGVDGHVGEAGRLLSGGEAQRVRLARMFNRTGTRLVVLDEATRGLDRALRASVREAIDERFAGVTTLAVTHDVDEALTLDRVVYIDGGRILADGAPSDLLSDPTNPFTRMVDAHRALDDSLTRLHGWSTARLAGGHLTVDHATVDHATVDHATVDEVSVDHPNHPANSPPAPQQLGDPLDPLEPVDEVAADTTAQRLEHVGAAPTRARHGPLGVALAVSAAAVVAMALEWALFLGGWSAMLGSARDGWWPLWFIASGTAAGVAVWLLGVAAVDIGTGLQRRLLIGGMRAPLDHVRSSGSGDLIGRVLEAEMFEQQAVTGSTDALFGVAQIVAAFAVLAVAGGPSSTGVLIAGWLAALLAIAVAATRSRRRWAQERIDRTRLLLERFRGRRTESVYGPPPRSTSDHLAEYRERSCRSDRWKTALIANADPWLVVAVAVTAQSAAGDTLLAGLGAVVLAWSGFGTLGVALDDLVTATAASRQFRQLLHGRRARPPARPPVTSPAAPASGDAVGVHEASFGHEGTDRLLLDDATFSVSPGTRTVLRGDSGSGKSTLGAILAGLRAPTAGNATGTDGVVYVAQFGDNHTFQSTLAFNLLMGRRWPPGPEELDDVRAVMESLGLEDLLRRMPRGVVQPVGEAGWQLSHGERGRLYLARALLQKPDVIVLDESLEGLDPRTARAALEVVTRHTPTVVLITHR